MQLVRVQIEVQYPLSISSRDNNLGYEGWFDPAVKDMIVLQVPNREKL